MNSEKNNFFMGIVVQTNDPEKRGRIKIYVPHISTTIYENLNKENLDKVFKFPDKNNNSDLNKIMHELKSVLPWAEYAGPIFGGNASGRFNAYNETGTTSDSNEWDENKKVVENGRPLQKYIGEDGAFPDAFSETGKKRNKFVNLWSYQYTPSDYSNLARGTFSIPNVGAHVWLWFRDGDVNFPVYFASSYGQEDFKRIYTMNQDTSDDTSIDYPAGYENKGQSDSSGQNQVVYDEFNTTTFRAKHVINTNKHSIELIDTDQREILKFTHFSGSFLEFTNHTNIEFAINNDQKMVLGDQFLTVRKNQNIYVAQCQDNIIEQDQYIKIGKKLQTTGDLTSLIATLQEIHNIKRLFTTQRAKSSEAPTLLSTLQERNAIADKGFFTCPVCNGAGTFKGYKCDVCNSGYYSSNYNFEHYEKYSPSTEGGMWQGEPKLTTNELNTLLLNRSKSIAAYERDLGIGGDQIIDINKNKIETIGLKFNDLIPYRVDPIGKLLTTGVFIAPCGLYVTKKPSHLVEAVAVDDYPGGDYNLTVYNKYKLLVGSRGIDIKTTGYTEIGAGIMSINSKTQLNINASSELLIDGGESTLISGKKITLQTRGDAGCKKLPVVINDNLHVTEDLIVKGNAMLGNETGVVNVNSIVNYVASNYETYEEDDKCIIEVPVYFNIPGIVTNYEGTIKVKPHYHKVPSLPMKLYKKLSDFLTNMMNINRCK